MINFWLCCFVVYITMLNNHHNIYFTYQQRIFWPQNTGFQSIVQCHSTDYNVISLPGIRQGSQQDIAYTTAAVLVWSDVVLGTPHWKGIPTFVIIHVYELKQKNKRKSESLKYRGPVIRKL